MMALAGNIEPFVEGTCFESYEDRVNQFFSANGVKEEKQTSMFITIAGSGMYEILKSLTFPEKPSSKPYEDILSLLHEHFTPKSNKRAERFKFNQVVQENGEGVSEFIVRLKSVSQLCKFGDFFDAEVDKNGNLAKYKIKVLDEALTDRFIIGLRSEKIKQDLMGKDDYNFEKCCEKALQMEMLQKESKSLQPQSSIKSIKGDKEKRVKQRSNSLGRSTGNFRTKDRSQSLNRYSNGRCGRCGRTHDEKTCPAREWKCFSCQKVGHISPMCRNKKQNVENAGKDTSLKSIRYNEADSGNFIKQIKKAGSFMEDTSTLEITVNSDDVKWAEHQEKNGTGRMVKTLKRIGGSALEYVVDVENKKVLMECDTGAIVTVMSIEEYREKFKHLPLLEINKESKVPLCTISGENLREVGRIEVQVDFGGKNKKMEIYVLDLGSPFMALMGRDWLNVFLPNWKKLMSVQTTSWINSVSRISIIEEITAKFPNIVSEKFERPIEGFTAELVLKDEATPIFHAAYTLPYKLKDRVSDEIDRLVNLKVLKPIKNSKWASPLVVRVKSNGELRFCIDGKVTINKYLETDHYPLPRIDDIFSSMSNCEVYCVIDLKGAFKQLELTVDSQTYVVINTHKGLYLCTRMFDGLKVAPAAFQSVMDQILVALEKVRCFIDDIIIGGKTIDECKSRLFEVLERLNKHNVRINIDKCKFFETKVQYLGHVLENNKISPNPDKVKAIVEAPSPTNVEQLQAYLGLLNYYVRFIPNLSAEIHLLYKLLGKDKGFEWTAECQSSFEKSKVLLTSNQVLEIYDPDKEMIVAADASPYGLGAVLSHMVNGVEKPVLFASSTLSPAEKNYSQPQREALGIIFALKKFYKYIYGKKFTIVTDHQSLRDLFNPKKGISPVAASRLQRWAVYMSMYDYTIRHKSGTKMGNADALSRLPLNEESEIEDINFLNFGTDIPIESKDVQEETLRDPLLSKVYEYVLNGWPKNFSNEFVPYFSKRNSLSTEDNCLFYMNRVVIPTGLKSKILKTLHECHTGIVRMKMMARSYVWWPRCDKDIEECVNNCLICQQTLPNKNGPVTSKWYSTTYPFERVHIDFASQAGKTFLIISDAYSKYCDVKLMTTTNMMKLEEKLLDFFSIFGLPKELVSDNGPPFQSYGFNNFCKSHKIEMTHTPPYHPPSNGQAERAVRTVKQCFLKFFLGDEQCLPIEKKIKKFLIYHNNTPSTVTGKSPSEIIFLYKPRTLLDLVNEKKKEEIDSRKRDLKVLQFESKYKVDQRVMYLNHCKSSVNWIPATVKQVISKYTYLILINGQVRFVHENQLKISKSNDSNESNVVTEPINLNTKVKLTEDTVDSPEKIIYKERSVSEFENNESGSEGKKVTFNLNNDRSKCVTEGERKTRYGRTIVKPKLYNN